MEKINVRRFYDMHCHFRKGAILRTVVPLTARYARYGLAMPNTKPQAILNAKHVHDYRDEIIEALHICSSKIKFDPVMTIECRENTTPEIVVAAHNAGALAAKMYLKGVTTNSDHGVRITNLFSPQLQKTYAKMAETGMILLIHGEVDIPNTLFMEWEGHFLPHLRALANRFPNLKIVMEHITTKEAVDVVTELSSNVAATITAHHLMITANDVVARGIRPHNACAPMPKDFKDLYALRQAATSGNKKFFLGSDSAPHPREKKECALGACGVFTAPILPSLMAQIFDEENALDKLQDFTSTHAAYFYQLPLCTETVTLVKESRKVPKRYGHELDIVPFMAGKNLNWRFEFS